MEEVNVLNLSDESQRIVKFILNNNKTSLPIKLSDIAQQLQSKSIRTVKQREPEVKKYLEQGFGLKLELLPIKGTPRYILYSKVKNLWIFNEKQSAKQSFLMMVLAIILLEYNTVSERQLEEHLETQRVYLNEEHEYFGTNLKKLLTETFVKEMYILRNKHKDEFGEVRFSYSWGYRSFKEYDRKQVVTEAAKICDLPVSEFCYDDDMEMPAENDENAEE